MARFTREQYEKAQRALADGVKQLEPDGRGCVICGDSGHQAFECGSNPLLAMATCRDVARRANELHDELHAIEDRMDSEDVAEDLAGWREDAHEFLHRLAGCDTWMGETVGPAKVRFPDPHETQTAPARADHPPPECVTCAGYGTIRDLQDDTHKECVECRGSGVAP